MQRKEKVQNRRSQKKSTGKKAVRKPEEQLATAVERRTPEEQMTPDLDMEWLREAASGVDARQVEDMTDRLFVSVLQRWGWQRNERGQIEHVGAGD